MTSSSERAAELALVNLAFAQAEIMAAGAWSDNLVRALQHIVKATANLKRLAPEFDYPFPHPDEDETEA